MFITIIIIIITCITSIKAFQSRETTSKLVFSPYLIKRRGEWHRFLTSGFIHGSWVHLFFNMYVLFLFGSYTEKFFAAAFQQWGAILYVILYVLAIVLSEVYSYFKHQDNPYYASLGASGAISAIVFASIVFNPLMKIGLIFIPFFGIPAFIFGILYLLYSMYMAKNGQDHIGHYAHFYGAVFGFLFPIILKPSLALHFFDLVIHGY